MGEAKRRAFQKQREEKDRRAADFSRAGTPVTRREAEPKARQKVLPVARCHTVSHDGAEQGNLLHDSKESDADLVIEIVEDSSQLAIHGSGALPNLAEHSTLRALQFAKITDNNYSLLEIEESCAMPENFFCFPSVGTWLLPLS